MVLRTPYIFLVVLFFNTLFFVTSCEDKEDDLIAQSQQCINQLPETPSSDQVNRCLNKINGVEKPKAYIIRCSGAFLKGGLTTLKLTSAFDNYDKQPKNEQEAFLVEQLALASISDADEAYSFCKKSEVPGLIFIASLTRIGTLIVNLTSGGSMADRIDDCLTNTDQCKEDQIGEMILQVSSLYCKGRSKDEQICKDVAKAITLSGGNTSDIGLYFLNEIKP